MPAPRSAAPPNTAALPTEIPSVQRGRGRRSGLGFVVGRRAGPAASSDAIKRARNGLANQPPFFGTRTIVPPRPAREFLGEPPVPLSRARSYLDTATGAPASGPAALPGPAPEPPSRRPALRPRAPALVAALKKPLALILIDMVRQMDYPSAESGKQVYVAIANSKGSRRNARIRFKAGREPAGAERTKRSSDRRSDGLGFSLRNRFQ